MSQGEALPKISAPAGRALASVGITTLTALADYRRAELAALHGMGPKALSVLESRLAEIGLRLRD
jgi:hypothetical protein